MGTTTATERAPELRLSISVSPRWRNVELLRAAVLACVSVVARETGTELVAVVASELVENAIKYGAWDEEERASLDLQIVSDGNVVDVTVSNPADAETFTVLQTMLEWIRSFPTAEEAYLARMRTLLEGDASGSRMGLLRVVYEARCVLTAERSEDSKRVLVRATMRLDQAPRRLP